MATLWFSWPVVEDELLNAQVRFLGICREDALEYAKVLGPFLTAITLGVTLLVHVTQFLTMGRAAQQAAMEPQIEALVDRLDALVSEGQKTMRSTLLTLIVKKAERLPIAADKEEFVQYLVGIRLTRLDCERLVRNESLMAEVPTVKNCLASLFKDAKND